MKIPKKSKSSSTRPPTSDKPPKGKGNGKGVATKGVSSVGGAKPPQAPATPPEQKTKKNWGAEFGLGMAESLGVDHFFKAETWRETGQGLNMLVTQPGRAANVLKDEFQQSVVKPLSAWGESARANPAGAAAGIRDGVVALAQSAGQGVQDVAQKSTLGLALLVTHPQASMQVLGDSPRELGNVFGTATGVGLDMISGGTTSVVRGSTRVGSEVAGSLMQQALRASTPSPVMLAQAATPNVTPSVFLREVGEVLDPLPAGPVQPRHIAGAGGGGPVSLSLSPEDLIDGEVRLGNIAGQSIMDVRLTLPVGQLPSQVADQIVASAPSYRDFLNTPLAPGRVDIDLRGLSDESGIGGIQVGNVAGGSYGHFEFNFARGVEVPPPAPPRPVMQVPPAVPESSALAPSRATIHFGHGGSFGDLSFGDIAGRSIPSSHLTVPASLRDWLPLKSALDDLKGTLSQHLGDARRVDSSVLIQMNPGGVPVGDVHIGDIAQGNIFSLRVGMPDDVTGQEAIDIVNGVREGLERLRAEAFPAAQ